MVGSRLWVRQQLHPNDILGTQVRFRCSGWVFFCCFGVLAVSVFREQYGRTQVFFNTPPWVFSGCPSSSTDAALRDTLTVPFSCWRNRFRAGVGFSFMCFRHFRLDPDCGVQLLAGKWEDGTAVCAGHFKGKSLRVLSGTCRNRGGKFSVGGFEWVRMASLILLDFCCAGYSRLCATFLLRCSGIRGRNVNCGNGMTESSTD